MGIKIMDYKNMMDLFSKKVENKEEVPEYFEQPLSPDQLATMETPQEEAIDQANDVVEASNAYDQQNLQLTPEEIQQQTAMMNQTPQITPRAEEGALTPEMVQQQKARDIAATSVPSEEEEEELTDQERRIALLNEFERSKAQDFDTRERAKMEDAFRMMNKSIAGRGGLGMPKLGPSALSQAPKERDYKEMMAKYKMLTGDKKKEETKSERVDRELKEEKRDKLRREAEKPRKTEAEKVIDREFGKEYNKWQSGGKADYEENSKIFREAIKQLKDDKVDTGTFSGMGANVPGVRTKTAELQNRVRKAINGMLRATLGAQFTEKEGERIFNQTFDPFASEESNIANMETELAKIEKRAQSMEDRGKHYRKNKTMVGYEPSQTSEMPVKEETVSFGGKDYRVGSTVMIKGKRFLIKDKKGTLEEVK